jgi:hypothetical protein
VASREEFNLYNPAFIALVQSEVARGHRQNSTAGICLPLVFGASTIALFEHLRRDLPSTTRTHLAKWLKDYPEFRPEFQRLVRGSVCPLRAGLLFALTHNAVVLDGASVLAQGRRLALPDSISTETVSILRTARFVGRWFAQAGTAATTLSLIGFSS